MRQSHLSLLSHALIGIGFTLTGCGGKTGDSTGTTGGPIAIDDLAHEEAVTFCNLFSRCNLAAYVNWVHGVAASPDICISYSENLYSNQSLVQLKVAIADGKATYDAAAARACLDAYERVACDYTNGQSDLAPCAKIFDGVVPIGSPCNSGYECAGGASTTACRSGTSTCPGVCTALADAGGPCSTSLDCLSGLECGMTSQVCEPVAKVGELCGGGRSYSCTGLAQCIEVSPATGESRCAVVTSDSLLKENAICDVFRGLDCAPGLTCTVVASESTSPSNLVYRCQKLVASGAPCQYAQRNPCPYGEFCPIRSTDVLTGTAKCTPQLEANQPCTGDYDNECGGFAQCLGGVCVTPARNGESCSDARYCYSANCQNGICQPLDACYP